MSARSVARAVALVLAATTLFAAGACRKSNGGVDAGPSPSISASSSAPAAVRIERASRERAWVEARSGDPLELARLCDAVGVDELAHVAEDDSAAPADRSTAIRAMAFADDPSGGVETLLRIALDPAPGAESYELGTLALQTLAAIAPRRHAVEETDPDAWVTAAGFLKKAISVTEEPTRRELMLRTLIGLADRGAVDRQSLPPR